MTEKRRLAAIFFSDIHQFTIMMERNENKMMQLLNTHNKIFNSTVSFYNGNIIKSTGDGFLIIFPSGSEALKCAMKIQSEIQGVNRSLPASERMLIRIGLHIGEIIERGGDVFGANVNIAARIEPQAMPGGIAMSRDIYNSLKSNIHFPCESIGEQSLKHVENPIEIFRVFPNEQVLKSIFGDEDSLTTLNTTIAHESKVIKKETITNRVVVTPFLLVGGNDDTAHLSEGFAEALRFGLVKEKKLNVLPISEIIETDSRDFVEIANRLGAAYVVHGMIQKSGSMLNIHVELQRISTEQTIFVEEYLRSIDDIFEVQIEIVKNVLYKILLRISSEVEASLATSKLKNPLAGNFYLKGIHEIRNAITWDDYRKGISLLEKSVKFDKSFIAARSALATAYVSVFGRWQNDSLWIEKAEQEAIPALEDDLESYEANEAMGVIKFHANELDEAELFLSNAINLRPETISGRINLSDVYIRQGNLSGARIILDEALELSEESGNVVNQFQAHNYIGRLNASQGFYLNALEEYGLALEIAQELKSTYLLSGIRLNMGHLYLKMGNPTLAMSNYSSSLVAFRKLKDLKNTAATLTALGTLNERMGDLKTALMLLDEGVKISESIGDSGTLASLLTNKGRILNNLGRNNEAVTTFEEAVSLWKERCEPIKEAKAMNNLAAVYCDMGDLDVALEKYQTTRDLVVELGDYTMLANVLLNLGEINEFRQDYESALETYFEAGQVFEKFDSSEYHQYYSLFLGRLFYLMGRYEEAISELEALIKAEHVRPAIFHRAELYLHMCEIKSGKAELDIEKLAMSLDKLKQIHSVPELVESYRIVGDFLRGGEFVEFGMSCLNNGLEIAENSGMKWEAQTIKNILEKIPSK